MKSEKLIEIVHPSAVVLMAIDKFTKTSRKYPFMKSGRGPLVELPLIREMNLNIGFSTFELSRVIHEQVAYYHSKFHQFEGPHHEVMVRRMGESLKLHDDSQRDVAEMILNYLDDVSSSSSEMFDFYTSAVAFRISERVHVSSHSEYIFATLV